MPSEAKYEDAQANDSRAKGTTRCLNCRAEMPREMRFCRSCGRRLGEGLAEYVETIRFEQSPRPAPHAAAQSRRDAATSALPPRAQQTVNSAFKTAENVFRNLEDAFQQSQVKLSARTHPLSAKRCGIFGRNTLPFGRQTEEINKSGSRHQRRTTWKIVWMMIVASFILSGFLSFLDSQHRRREMRIIMPHGTRQQVSDAMREQADALRQQAEAMRESIAGIPGLPGGVAGARSMLGVSGFSSASSGGGAIVESIVLPGTPADKAGLVGGDCITSFDGQPIKSERDMRRLLAATPSGKSVEVLFSRDGEAKRTTLAPVSADEFEKLRDSRNESSSKHGVLGVDADFECVAVPGTNIYGVRLDGVERNGPAAIAGLRDKDIVIEFDGTPIRTSQEFAARIKRTAPGGVVKAVVMRGTDRLEIPVKMGQNG